MAYFVKLHMRVYLRANFQDSSIILTSFGQRGCGSGVILAFSLSTSKRTPKKPTHISFNNNFFRKNHWPSQKIHLCHVKFPQVILDSKGWLSIFPFAKLPDQSSFIFQLGTRAYVVFSNVTIRFIEMSQTFPSTPSLEREFAVQIFQESSS